LRADVVDLFPYPLVSVEDSMDQKRAKDDSILRGSERKRSSNHRHHNRRYGGSSSSGSSSRTSVSLGSNRGSTTSISGYHQSSRSTISTTALSTSGISAAIATPTPTTPSLLSTSILHPLHQQQQTPPPSTGGLGLTMTPPGHVAERSSIRVVLFSFLIPLY
jgi:hypothetical protein